MRDDDNHTEDQFLDHMQRIGRIVAAWHAGGISTGKKRAAIADENCIYYERKDLRICKPYGRSAA